MSHLTINQVYKLRKIFDRFCTHEGEVSVADLRDVVAQFGMYIRMDGMINDNIYCFQIIYKNKLVNEI